MNIISFTYTKADGTASKRVLSPVVQPFTMYEGTDLSELTMEGQVQYCQALGRLQDEHTQKVLLLQASFDLGKRYRRFDPKKMTDVVKEAV